MREYTLRFFVLLKAAFKRDAQEKLELINIVSIPHMKTNGRNSVVRAYAKMVENDDKSKVESVKRDRELLLKKLKGQLL